MRKSTLIRGGISALALVGTMAAPAFADSVPVSNQSLTTAVPSLLDKFSATYVNAFDGPAVSALASPYQSSNLDGTVDPTSPVMFENTLSLGYKISKTVTIAPTFYWQYRVGGNDALRLGGDSYLKIGHSNMYSYGTYKLTGFASI